MVIMPVGHAALFVSHDHADHGLGDAEVKLPGYEGVPQRVEDGSFDLGPLGRCFESAGDVLEGLPWAFVENKSAIGWGKAAEKLEDGRVHRDPAGFFALGVLDRDRYHPLPEADVLASQLLDFADPHPGVRRQRDHRLEVFGRGRDKPFFLAPVQEPLPLIFGLEVDLDPLQREGHGLVVVDRIGQDRFQAGQLPIQRCEAERVAVDLGRFPGDFIFLDQDRGDLRKSPAAKKGGEVGDGIFVPLPAPLDRKSVV